MSKMFLCYAFRSQHSLPPQLVDTILALNTSLQYKLHEDVLIYLFLI